MLKKKSHPKMLKKGTTNVGTPNLFVIIVVRKDIQLICARLRLLIRMSSIRAWFTVISATNKDIRKMSTEPRPCMHKDLKDIAITIRSMDIEL